MGACKRHLHSNDNFVVKAPITYLQEKFKGLEYTELAYVNFAVRDPVHILVLMFHVSFTKAILSLRLLHVLCPGDYCPHALSQSE